MAILIDFITKNSSKGKLSWIYFLFFAFLVILLAIKLVSNAEHIMSKTKFGSGFVGGVLIATVTSFPELITEIAQGINNTPSIGIADDVGSNAFSGFMIFLAFLILYKKNLNTKIDKWSKITIFISFILSLFLLLLVLINRDFTIGKKNTFAFGLIPVSFFIIYLTYLFFQYRYGNQDENIVIKKKDQTLAIKKHVFLFLFYGTLLVAGSIMMNASTTSMQNTYKISHNTIGGLFLSISTSLPEIIAFIILLKNNQPIAAISSLIGSHIFNLSAIFFGDLAYVKDATFNNPEVFGTWKLVLMCTLIIFVLFLNAIIVIDPVKHGRWRKTVLPLIGIAIYVFGWIFILLL